MQLYNVANKIVDEYQCKHNKLVLNKQCWNIIKSGLMSSRLKGNKIKYFFFLYQTKNLRAGLTVSGVVNKWRKD